MICRKITRKAFDVIVKNCFSGVKEYSSPFLVFWLKFMFEIVLINPEIPQNTGNIARTVLSQKCRLHLVKPYGFRLDTAAVKRAGVDYWKFVEITEWESADEFFSANDTSKMHFFSQKGLERYDRVSYKSGDFLVFGCESAGLGSEILNKYRSRTRFLPMLDSRVRSLNLASAATAVIFEAMKQLDFIEENI